MISNFEAKKADIFAFLYFSPLYLIRKSKEYTFHFFVNHDIRALSTFKTEPVFLGNEPRNFDAKVRTRHEPFCSRGIRLSDRSSESNHDWLIVNCEGRIKAAMFSLCSMLS